MVCEQKEGKKLPFPSCSFRSLLKAVSAVLAVLWATVYFFTHSHQEIERDVEEWFLASLTATAALLLIVPLLLIAAYRLKTSWSLSFWVRTVIFSQGVFWGVAYISSSQNLYTLWTNEVDFIVSAVLSIPSFALLLALTVKLKKRWARRSGKPGPPDATSAETVLDKAVAVGDRLKKAVSEDQSPLNTFLDP